ncbi:uncharacterized protein LOC133692176 isoform X2 [Populus nigra]|uniref:uncharacterized protein LOC133692176 isoform X2 n=1 Tax=Populus nigra TaxID=3691 RepID=UPI002B26E497|nr:uncharacterized protein LOC133692176 isoform X2 [Populus nigra]
MLSLFLWLLYLLATDSCLQCVVINYILLISAAVEIACACARMANNPQFSGGGQYHDDKTRIKDAMKLGKITMVMATRRIKRGKRKKIGNTGNGIKVLLVMQILTRMGRRSLKNHADIAVTHAYTPESDGESHESRQKRHKRDNQDGSHRNGGYEELEDGELGEDGEICKQPMAAEIDI